MLKALIWLAVAALAAVGGAWVWKRRRVVEREVRGRLATAVRKGGRRAQRATSKLARQLA